MEKIQLHMSNLQTNSDVLCINILKGVAFVFHIFTDSMWYRAYEIPKK